MNTKEKIEARKQFLIANPNLSHKKAARELSNMGIRTTDGTVAAYRCKYSITFRNEKQLVDLFEQAINNGEKFKTVSEVSARFECSHSYAARMLRQFQGYVPIPRGSKTEPMRTFRHVPVPVNTMEFYVQQLTANDSSYEVVANG